MILIAIIARSSYLQCRVIVHLGIDTIDQLCYRQFYQRCLQQLLIRIALTLFQLLCLFLYLTEPFTHSFSLLIFHFSLLKYSFS